MTLRWAVVGCGSVAEHKGGPALYNVEGSELTVAMSRDRQRAAGFAERHGAKRYYTRFEDVLADDEVNAIYVATPPHVHAAQAVAAARAGKHILCEKPMALTVAECDRIIAEALQRGVQLMVAYYRRRYPAVVKLKELLDAGCIGRPTKIRTEVAGCYQPPADGSKPWRTDPAIAGGGFLWDIGSHRIDLMVHLMGDVRQVAAFADTVVFDLAVEDSASLILRFANGAHGVGVYHWTVAHGGDEIEIGGTQGRILCDMNTGLVRLVTDAGRQQWELAPPGITHQAIVADLVEAVRQGRPNCSDGAEGRKTSAIIEAAMLSSRRGRVVEVAQPE